MHGQHHGLVDCCWVLWWPRLCFNSRNHTPDLVSSIMTSPNETDYQIQSYHEQHIECHMCSRIYLPFRSTIDYSRFPLGSCWSVFSLREWNSMHSSFFAISLLLNCLNHESTNLKLSIQAPQESPVLTNRTSYFQHSYSCIFGIFCLLYTGIVQQNNRL